MTAPLFNHLFFKLDAETILDLDTDNIYKNYRITFIPFCYLKPFKIKQKQNDIFCGN